MEKHEGHNDAYFVTSLNLVNCDDCQHMSYNYLPLDRNWISFEQVQHYLQYSQHVSITYDAHKKITRCRDYLDKKLAESNELFYGINTGFGFMQHVHIDDSQTEQLQFNLLKSHACGMGEEVPAEIVKL